MLTLSLVIVTYKREQVLIDTITSLLEQVPGCDGFGELIVVDQTKRHTKDTQLALERLHESGAIRWIRLPRPDLTGAMNRGLLEAKTDLVLYLDDDIIPGRELLLAHQKAHATRLGVSAVVGQILQPGERPEDLSYEPHGGVLLRYMDFPFRSTRGAYIENAMAGNLSVSRKRAIEIGGFDENFRPPVASRFETEFAKRVSRCGGKIWFEPRATINHLAAQSGGTRALGSHLSSSSPRYGVGDYYFALLHGQGLDSFFYCIKRFFREVRTKFHLTHPWYIPVKLLGETRAIRAAVKLRRRPQALIDRNTPGR